MASSDDKPIFGYETLAALGSRLKDHAADIIARRDAAADMHAAAAALDRFATLLYALDEIVAKAIANPQWDNASIARDILTAAEAAKGGSDR
jgi:hypothetical protein